MGLLYIVDIWQTGSFYDLANMEGGYPYWEKAAPKGYRRHERNTDVRLHTTSLQGTCLLQVSVIFDRFSELPLHPHPIHLQLTFPIDQQPSIHAELSGGEKRMPIQTCRREEVGMDDGRWARGGIGLLWLVCTIVGTGVGSRVRWFA